MLRITTSPEISAVNLGQRPELTCLLRRSRGQDGITGDLAQEQIDALQALLRVVECNASLLPDHRRSHADAVELPVEQKMLVQQLNLTLPLQPAPRIKVTGRTIAAGSSQAM